MSVRRANVRLWSLLPRAVLTSVASFAIRVPVLMGAGQFDPGVCGRASICASLEASDAAFAIAEAPFFGPDACLETVMIEDAGHYLNLGATAPATYALIRAWSDAHVGLYQAAPPCGPGRMLNGGPRGILALGASANPTTRRSDWVPGRIDHAALLHGHGNGRAIPVFPGATRGGAD